MKMNKLVVSMFAAGAMASPLVAHADFQQREYRRPQYGFAIAAELD